jgi:isopenicillin-N epimerase
MGCTGFALDPCSTQKRYNPRTMPETDSFWLAQRDRMARDPRKINLNAGTLSPTPLPVLEAVTRLREEMAANPSNFVWRRTGPLIDLSRQRLAAYLGCDPLDLLLLPNATLAINVIAQSLEIPAGAEVLTTDHEYGAMMLCWRRAAVRGGWSLVEVPLPYRCEDPQEIVDALARGITPRTRVLYFSHVTTSTGLVLPAEALVKLAREHGLLCIIDGAHAPGMFPVNLGEMGADFYTANCHKWLMAPAGSGFLHVSRAVRERIQPLITSWGFDYDRSAPDLPSGWAGSRWQWEHEFHGTTDRTPQMVLPEALDFRQELGGDEAIRRRVAELSDYARQALAKRGLECVTPRNERLRGALVAFDIACGDLVAARNRLYNEFDIECPLTTAAGKTFLRVSTAWLNTKGEIDRLAEAAVTLTSGIGR